MVTRPAESAAKAGNSTMRPGPMAVHCRVAVSGLAAGVRAAWTASSLMRNLMTARNGSGPGGEGQGSSDWSLEVIAAPTRSTFARFKGETTSMLTMVNRGAGLDMMV